MKPLDELRTQIDKGASKEELLASLELVRLAAFVVARARYSWQVMLITTFLFGMATGMAFYFIAFRIN